PFVIRTMDIGADKQLPYFEIPEEDNPSLGMRAIRFSLRFRDIFKTQLRAILRASNHGPIKLMYPFISSLEEVREANQLLAEVNAELSAHNNDWNPQVETGIMIELPAAVTIADLLAEE